MAYLDNLLFLIILIAGAGYFALSLKKIYRNIQLGQDINRNDQPKKRWQVMAKVALGQSKMRKRPVAGFLHMLIYVGFLLINLELIEIVVDGIFGTHRFLASVIGDGLYSALTATLEVLALLVLVAVVAFFVRRNFMQIERFKMSELFGWPKNDANWILLIEFVLMTAFFLMNAADAALQAQGQLPLHGSFPISGGWLVGSNEGFLHILEKGSWWLHFVGILFFMNYLYYSKHLHIILAFPSTWYANLDNLGRLTNLDSVTKEIKLMMDPNADPYAAPPADEVPAKFGASDVFDLNKVQLLNAYSCTECGRCTAVCPANTTGKKLSPRKIMMSVRDRLEEVSANIDLNKTFVDDQKQLLDNHISREELWACTSCNACTDACPILLDPLSIIVEMRRYLVMEQSAAPNELNIMMGNVENNGAPWPYNAADRLKWTQE
jgi:heterodisulfide reductase subunit C